MGNYIEQSHFSNYPPSRREELLKSRLESGQINERISQLESELSNANLRPSITELLRPGIETAEFFCPLITFLTSTNPILQLASGLGTLAMGYFTWKRIRDKKLIPEEEKQTKLQDLEKERTDLYHKYGIIPPEQIEYTIR